MQTVAVIGGSGFIGSRFVCRLKCNEQIDFTILDKAPSKAYPHLVTQIDVRSVEQLRVAITDGSVIVNLAAEHRDDVRPLSLYDEVNVGGARNVESCGVYETAHTERGGICRP